MKPKALDKENAIAGDILRYKTIDKGRSGRIQALLGMRVRIIAKKKL
jgi:hypothetical protein